MARLNHTSAVAGLKGNPVDRITVIQDKTHVLRHLLRAAIDKSGWKHDALAIAMGLADGPYLSKLLAGEKTLGAHHLADLPDDVERIFAQLYAEQFGHIVVQPVHGEDAIKQLVCGLLGVLSNGLPAKAGKPLKCEPEEK